MKTLLKVPATLSFHGENFARVASCAISDPALAEELKKRADAYLAAEPLTVTKRAIRAPSKDAHDYASFGPYWWPNPNTESGLPYIRRDGEINPATRDPNNPSAVFTRVKVLTLAAILFDDDRYAEAAVGQIRAWYLDPETKMTPNLRYGQGIPGICDGRGIGMIDCAGSYEFFDAVALLDAAGLMPEDVLLGLRAWYGDFLDWMLTSETGVDEDRQHNNHGTWYDVQVVSTALFLGRKILANRTASLAYERRLLKHIEPDGSQPAELARTKAFHYSCYNLIAEVALAKLSRLCDVKFDYFARLPEGYALPPLRAALDFLLPYAEDLAGFPYPEISNKPATSDVAALAHKLAAEYPDAGYEEISARLAKPGDLWRLLPG